MKSESLWPASSFISLSKVAGTGHKVGSGLTGQTQFPATGLGQDHLLPWSFSVCGDITVILILLVVGFPGPWYLI